MTEEERLRLRKRKLELEIAIARAKEISPTSADARTVAPVVDVEPQYGLLETVVEKVGSGASLGALPAMQTAAELALKPVAEGRGVDEGWLDYLSRISGALSTAPAKVAASSVGRMLGIGEIPEVEQIRGQYLARGEQMEKERPVVSAVSSTLGSVASPANLLGVVGPATSLGRAALIGAGQSALGTAAGSLGEGRELPLSEAILSPAFGAAFGGLTAGLFKGANWAKQRHASARQKALEKVTAGVEKDISGKLGAYRSAVQSGSRGIENLQRLAQSGDVVGGEAERIAAEALSGGGVKDVAEMVAQNTAEQLPSRLGEIASLRAEYEAANAAKQQTIQDLLEKQLQSPIAREGGARLKKSALRYIPTAIGAAGGAALADFLGLDSGGVAGGLGVGGFLGNALGGQPGTAVMNMVKNPAFQHGVFSKLAPAMSATGQAASLTLTRASSALADYFTEDAEQVKRASPEQGQEDFTRPN